MDPITNYRLAKYQHEEIQAEFERYQRYRLNDPVASGWPPQYPRLVGWGSLLLGTLIILQEIIG